MKRLTFLLLFSVASFSFSQVKIWNQSTVSDFSAGSRSDVVISPDSGGSLMIRPPLKRAGNDTIVASAGVRSYNDSGNYVITWIASRRVMAQKFNAANQSLTPVLTVDDSVRATGSNAPVALLNDGSFCIVWTESYQAPLGIYHLPYVSQFFSPDGNRIGGNLPLFTTTGTNPTYPQIIADRTLQRYLILASVIKAAPGGASQSTEAPLMGYIFESDGKLTKELFTLNSRRTATREESVQGICFRDIYILTWTGYDYGVTGRNIFAATYSSNELEPITAPITVNGSIRSGKSPIVAISVDSVTLVGWIDTRLSGYGNIFYRLLAANGTPIGPEFLLSDHAAGSSNLSLSNILWKSDTVEIQYGEQFQNGQPPTPWLSRWIYDPVRHGDFVSSIFDAGSNSVNYKSVSWNGQSSPSRRLSLQLKSAVSLDAMDTTRWYGPLTPDDVYLTGTGTPISPRHNDNRYIQYRMMFDADSVGMSPVLNDVSISYVPSDTIPPPSPVLTKAAGEHRRIVLEWQQNNSSGIERYRIQRTTDSLCTWELPAAVSAFIDSSLTPGRRYEYRVFAIDSSHNVSAPAIPPLLTTKTMTVYVSKTGTATAAGSFSNPFSTIGAAMNFAGLGDTVWVMPGDYAENVSIKERVLLTGSGPRTTTIFGSVDALKRSTVTGFTIIGGYAVFCSGDSVRIDGNVLKHQGSGSDDGVNCFNHSYITVTRNIITGYFVGVYVGVPACFGCVIRNNIINSDFCILNRGMASAINNTFIVRPSCVGIGNQKGTIEAANNCFACTSPGDLLYSAITSSSGLSARYNNRWNSSMGVDPLPATDFSLDPQFISLPKNNVHYRPSSPCIDAGDPAPAFNDRNGSRNDIGAYGGPDPLPEDISIIPIAAFSLSSAAAAPGDTIRTAVRLTPAAGMMQAGFSLSYDPQVLTYRSIQRTPLTTAFTCSVQTVQPGRIVVTLLGPQEVASGSGDICTISFKINPAAPPHTQTPIQLGNVWAQDSLGTPFFIESTSGGSVIIIDTVVTPHHLYVDAQYSGIEKGTLRQPFSAIQKGIAAAADGDTIVVSPGSYDGGITMRTGVYVRGSGATTSTIELPNNPLSTTPAAVSFSNVSRSGISGFTIINRNTMARVVEVKGSDIVISSNRLDQGMAVADYISVNAPSTVTITQNVFLEGLGGLMHVIGAYGAGSFLTVTANEFYNLYSDACVGLQNGASAQVVNNLFIGENNQNLLYLNLAGKATIANNLFLDIAGGCTGINAVSADTLIIFNNVFFTKYAGIREKSAPSRILNNIFLDSATGISYSPMTSHHHNLFWRNNISCAPGPLDPTEQIADPLFVNSAAGDYRLQTASPARDAGDPSPQWSDRDGTRNDLGIFGGPLADTTLWSRSRGGLAIASLTAHNGDTIPIPVYGWRFGGMKEIHAIFSFEENKLDLVELRPTNHTQDCLFTRKNIGSAMIECILQSSSSLPDDSVALMELVFVIHRAAASNAVIHFAGARAMNSIAQEYLIEEQGDGAISVINSVSSAQSPIPCSYALYQNYPNPFNPSTTITFDLPASEKVSLVVYDLLGREVMAPVDGFQSAGRHSIVLQCGRLASGIYFYVCRMGEGVFVKKMMLLR